MTMFALIPTPTVGRIVRFHPNEHDSLHKNNSAEFHAAIITQVWTPTMVNMIVFPAYGLPEIRSSVDHGTESEANANSYWAWPPREG